MMGETDDAPAPAAGCVTIPDESLYEMNWADSTSIDKFHEKINQYPGSLISTGCFCVGKKGVNDESCSFDHLKLLDWINVGSLVIRGADKIKAYGGCTILFIIFLRRIIVSNGDVNFEELKRKSSVIVFLRVFLSLFDGGWQRQILKDLNINMDDLLETRVDPDMISVQRAMEYKECNYE